MWNGHEWQWLAVAGAALFYVIALGHVLHALMTVRTSQGAIAWIACLIAFPWIAIPFYWIAGRSRFSGYVHARRADDKRLSQLADDMHRKLRDYEIPPGDAFGRAAQLLGGLPFTRGNSLQLLIDGEETFRAIFEAIASARQSLVVNFFIVKSDRVGIKFQQALIERAKAGVKVLFLFDEIGSHKLPRNYLRELRQAGVKCESFGANRYWWSRLQLNFRNHRKIVVVDGLEAFIGGINVGDEYLGRDKRFGAWRDTHMRVTGPAAHAVQLVFLEDWFWATGEVPQLPWPTEPQEENQTAAILPTGPADPVESWQLVVAEAANSAHRRLWITSPYFVPDGGVLTALQTAAFRGVDVRILLPHRPDHLLVWLSSYTYYEQTIPFGVKLYRYQDGFLHQKVLLVDDQLAGVSSANLDNRSFRLNFEITGLSHDRRFVNDVANMLEEDFDRTKPVVVTDFTQRNFFFRAACRLARLMAPVQ